MAFAEKTVTVTSRRAQNTRALFCEGIGKTTLLRLIASGQLTAFPSHMKVLHVRQEVVSHQLDLG